MILSKSLGKYVKGIFLSLLLCVPTSTRCVDSWGKAAIGAIVFVVGMGVGGLYYLLKPESDEKVIQRNQELYESLIAENQSAGLAKIEPLLGNKEMVNFSEDDLEKLAQHGDVYRSKRILYNDLEAIKKARQELKERIAKLKNKKDQKSQELLAKAEKEDLDFKNLEKNINDCYIALKHHEGYFDYYPTRKNIDQRYQQEFINLGGINKDSKKVEFVYHHIKNNGEFPVLHYVETLERDLNELNRAIPHLDRYPINYQRALKQKQELENIRVFMKNSIHYKEDELALKEKRQAEEARRQAEEARRQKEEAERQKREKKRLEKKEKEIERKKREQSTQEVVIVGITVDNTFETKKLEKKEKELTQKREQLEDDKKAMDHQQKALDTQATELAKQTKNTVTQMRKQILESVERCAWGVIQQLHVNPPINPESMNTVDDSLLVADIKESYRACLEQTNDPAELGAYTQDALRQPIREMVYQAYGLGDCL